MSTRVLRGKSKPMRVGLRTGIIRLRMPMDDILFYGKENVLTVERNHFRKLWFILWSVILTLNLLCIINMWTKVLIKFTWSSIYGIILMCVDCVLASLRITQIHPSDEPSPMWFCHKLYKHVHELVPTHMKRSQVIHQISWRTHECSCYEKSYDHQHKSNTQKSHKSNPTKIKHTKASGWGWRNI
jgi:hypothetical protein